MARSAVKGWRVQPTYEDLLRVLESVHCGIVVRDGDGRIIFANRLFLNWTGHGPADLDGATADVLLPEELRDDYAEYFGAVLQGDLRGRLLALRRQDGRTFPVVTLPALVRAGSDDAQLVINVVIDLGEVQTAQRIGELPGGSLAESLRRIAREIEAIRLSAASTGTSLKAEAIEGLALTAREREILSELMAGSRVPAIARRLFISPHTVRNHLKAIYRKAGVSSQGELMERLRQESPEQGPSSVPG